MIAQIKMRRGTTAEWAAANPVVLAAGEPGWDSTLEGMKVGDGSTEWAALPWIDAKNSLADILLAIYPIGAIYQSTVSTSPATLFGGTWAALGGRMLIGADGTYTAGSTGGEATHTLTVEEMPGHNHRQTYKVDNVVVEGATGIGTMSAGTAAQYNAAQYTANTGGGGAHNNLPPYLAVYMWKRTA